MKYIAVMKKNVPGIDPAARRQSKDGRVMLNENDLKCMPGTLEEKVKNTGGTLLSGGEAMIELNKEEWI